MDSQPFALDEPIRGRLAMKAVRGLYAITTEKLGTRLPEAVDQALQGGATVIQYRDKSTDAQRRLAQCRALKSLCTAYGAVFIVNDDYELACAVEADGVHLGEHDGALAAARVAMGPRALIGISCYNNLLRAEQAQQQGADYVAFGRFFPSRSKPDARQAGIGLLQQARRVLKIPVVAIGGMTAANAAGVVAAGADAVAVIDDIFGSDDIISACRAYQSVFASEKGFTHDTIT